MDPEWTPDANRDRRCRRNLGRGGTGRGERLRAAARGSGRLGDVGIEGRDSARQRRRVRDPRDCPHGQHRFRICHTLVVGSSLPSKAMEPSARAISETELLENMAWVQALARKLVSDPSSAEDVAQDTWLAALERPPTHVRGEGLRHWLSRVAQTLAWQRTRSAATRAARERDVARPEAVPSTHELLAQVAMQQRIVEAVVALDEPERTTVLLRHFHGLNARQIAEQRGESPEAVRKRLSRALLVLRGRLEREFGTGQDGMVRALTPLALLGWQKATPMGTWNLLGGALVTKAIIAIGIGAAAVVIGAVAWILHEGTGLQPRTGEPVEAANTQLAPGIGETEEASAEVLLAGIPEEGGAERLPVSPEGVLRGAVYALLDPGERPIVGARLVLCREGEVLATGETDRSGEFATEENEDKIAKLLILAPGIAPEIRGVSLKPMRHVVRLEPRAVVSGEIIVDGRRPLEPIPLQLRSDQAFINLSQELGTALEAAGLDRLVSRVIRRHTDPTGHFIFEGLASDWSGILELPVDYRLRDQVRAASDWRPCSTRLDRPEQGIRVDVVTRLVITGRIIEFPKREPVPVADADVESWIVHPDSDPNLAYQGMERTDGSGRFRIALLNPSILGGHLTVQPPGREFARQVDIEPRKLSENWDLGDIALVDREDAQEIRLVVRDEAKDPIQGAVAGTDSSSPFSPPTNEEGRTVLHNVVLGLSTIVVYCVGYEVTTVDIPSEPQEEVEVTMRGCALLEIQFRSPDGSVAPMVCARLAANRLPFRDERSSAQAVMAFHESGCSLFRTGWTDDNTSVVRANGYREGRVIFNDLVPGIPFHLRVDGGFGTTIQEQDIDPLRPGEHRKTEITLVAEPRTLRGRVLNEAGEPLPHATVAVGHRPPDYPPRDGVSSSIGFPAEDDGSFVFKNIYSPTVALIIDAYGYAPFRDEQYPVPLGMQQADIRLSKGREVTVIVEDEGGKPMLASVSVALSRDATALGFGMAGRKGAYILRGLPDEVVTIEANVHDVVYTQTHDPLVPELRMTVPVLGDVEVLLHRFGDLELDEMCGVWILPQGGSHLVRRYAEIPADPSGSMHIPGVLPGSYELVLQRWLGGFFPDARFEEMSARIRILVGPGETTKAEIWK